MSVSGDSISVERLGGVDERIPQPATAADEITNFTRHQRTGGFDNRIGYERYFFDPEQLWQPFNALGRIDSLYIWSRHQGALRWTLFESGGTLWHLMDWGDTFRIDSVITGRTQPAANQPAAAYVPFGRFLCVVNGEDQPLKYVGWPSRTTSPSIPVYPLGWYGLPAAPDAWEVDVSPSSTAGVGDIIGIWAGDTAQEVGLGSGKDSTTNSYRWRVAFRNNAGSLSPLSEPSNRVEWITPAAGTWQGSRFVVGMQIPTGPSGTLSRVMFRTKNLGDGDADSETYYEVMEIPNNDEDFWYDHLSDSQLGAQAPSESDSIPMPAPQARFGEVFKNCLFLDGGVGEETRMYWSNPGEPDTYSALDFADVGGRDSGGITGYRAHYNFMVVMRERGIDIVQGDYVNGFQVKPLAQGIGGRAAHTMTTIPELGILLLATDGVYLVSGSIDGGGTVSIRKLSDPVMRTMERMNLDTMARATAAYSHKWREWHCYFPVDGGEKPGLGLVLHLDNGDWSIRSGFPVSCLATDYRGDLIFGHHTGDNGAGEPDQSGLFVISRRRSTGGSYVAAEEQVPAYVTDNAPPVSRYRSAWHDMGDARAKKHIKHVYLRVLTMGDNAITMNVYKDGSFAGTSTAAYRMQRSEHADQGVYGVAAIGTAEWEDHLVTEIRYDIADKSCGTFLWEIETSDDIVMLGYVIEYTVGGVTKIIQGKRR